MTTGIQSKGTDLDSIFDPYVAGTTKARAAGIAVAGSDTSNRYASITYGSAAAATGIESENADLNTLYAALGTAHYATPDNGTAYNGNYIIPNGQSGSAGLRMYVSSLSPLQYTVAHAGTNTATISTWTVPTGMLYFKATLTYVSGTAAATVVQTTGWTGMSSLSQMMAEMISSVESYAFGTMVGSYTCGLQFSPDGVKTVYTGSTTWNYKLDSSA